MPERITADELAALVTEGLLSNGMVYSYLSPRQWDYIIARLRNNDTLRAALRDLLAEYREVEAALISFNGQKRPDDMSRYEALAAGDAQTVEWRGNDAYVEMAEAVRVGTVWLDTLGRWRWLIDGEDGFAPTEAAARAAVERAVSHE